MKCKRLFFMALVGMVLSLLAVGCNDSSDSKSDDRPTYTVSYFEEGGNPLPDLEQDVVSGSEIILPTPSRAGYTFSGWLLNNDGSVMTGKYKVQEDTEFYGKWTPVPASQYAVEYYDGPNIITSLTQTAASGTSVTLAAAQTKTGHTFNGWLEKGAGSPKAAGSSYTVNGATAFTASWTINTFSVTFNDGAADLPALTKTDVAYNSQIALPTITKAGSTFNGWQLGGTGAAAMEHTVTAAANFIASWTVVPANQYSVEYYDGGNIITALTELVDDGTDVAIADDLAKTGYTFNGWLKNGGGTPEMGGDPYTVTADTKFVASWTINQFRVIFKDGSSEISNTLRDYNSTVAIPKAPSAKDNFIFEGWINNGKGYATGDSFAVTADATFTARWTAQATVSFYDEKGRVFADYTKKAGIGEEIKLPDLHKPHYIFDGWLVGNTGDPVKDKYKISGATKLYAKYTIKPTSPFNTADPDIAAYYGDETRSWLISPADLKAMLDDPTTAAKVIIWSDSANNNPKSAGDAAKVIQTPSWNNSPGIDDGTLQTNNRFLRNEGPIANEHQVMNGVNIDNRLQRLGATKDSIIVLTSQWSTAGAGSNVIGWWWYLAYWGFSKDNLKILNGGNIAYQAAFGDGEVGATREAFPATPSTAFSVKELPGDRFDAVRISLGDNIKNIENGDYASGRKLMFSSLTNAMGDWFDDGFGNKQTINFYGFNYGGKMRGQKFLSVAAAPNNYPTISSTVPNPSGGADLTVYRYRTAEELKLVYRDREKLNSGTNVTLLPDELGASIGIWCGSGTTTQQYFMALQMAGYYNAANFGGNSNGWFTLAAHRLRVPNPNNDSSITTTVGLNLPQHANWKALDNSSHYSMMAADPADGSGYLYSYRANLGFSNNLCGTGIGEVACDPANPVVRSAYARQFLKYNDNGTFTVYDNMSRPTGEILDPFTNTSFYRNEMWPPVDASGVPQSGPENNRKDLNGNYKWDVAKWTDYITYNFNDNVIPHIYAIGNITMDPNYDGDANEIARSDARYKYTPAGVGSVDVTFEDQGGNSYDYLATTATPYTLVKVPEAPFKLYHDFDGWFVDGRRVLDFFEVKGADTTVVAKFTMKTTSPYHPNNASYYDAIGDGKIDNRSLIIEPSDLKALLDGPDGDKVIIVNLAGSLANELAGIPNTELAPTHKDGTPAFRVSYSEWRDHFRMFTSDVGPTHVPNHTNPTTKAGPARMATVDAYLQSWGYDLDKIIVFTRDWTVTANSNNVVAGMGGYTPTDPFGAATGFRDTGQTGMFNAIHLLYWGIAKDKIRILNGGNQAYRADVGSGNGKMSTEAKPAVTGNTFSVKQFPGDRIGSQLGYTHMGDILENVRRNDYATGKAAFVGAGGTYMDSIHPWVYRFPTVAAVAAFPKPLPRTWVDGDVVYRKYHSSGSYGMSGSWAGAVRGGDMFWMGNSVKDADTGLPPTGNTPGVAAAELFNYFTDQTDKDTGETIGTGASAGRVTKVKPYDEFVANFKHGHTDIKILTDRFTRIATHCGGSVSSMPITAQLILHGFHVSAYSGAGEDWMYRGAFKAVNDLAKYSDNASLVDPDPNRVYDFWGPNPTQYLMYVNDGTYAVYDNKSVFVANVSVDNRSLFVPVNERVLATEGRKWDPQAHTDFISFRLGGTAMDYRSYTGDGRGYVRQDLGDKYPDKYPFIADKEIPPLPAPNGDTRYYGTYLSEWGLTH